MVGNLKVKYKENKYSSIEKTGILAGWVLNPGNALYYTKVYAIIFDDETKEAVTVDHGLIKLDEVNG